MVVKRDNPTFTYKHLVQVNLKNWFVSDNRKKSNKTNL